MRPLYGPRKQETPLADGRLDALALCLLKCLGVRDAVVCALSALEAYGPYEKPVVWRSQLSEVLLAEGSPTHPHSRVSITSAISMRNFGANGAASISYSSRFATHVPASQMYELHTYIFIMIAVSTAVPVRRRIRSEYVCMRSKPSLMKRQSGLEAQCVPFFVGTIQATWYISCVELSQSLRALFKTAAFFFFNLLVYFEVYFILGGSGLDSR